jgi:alkylation response protein AidB-like acyl-CoA dehydrogenase
MSIAITADHTALAEVVRSFATAQGLRAHTRLTIEVPTNAPDLGPVWKQMAELGWVGLHLPEQYGGSGFGLPELAIVAEGLGAEVASGPFLATAVAAAVILDVGTEAQRAALLPSIADGTTAVSLALHTALDGDSGPALGGAWARRHLVAVGADLVVVDAEAVTAVPLPGLDPSLGLVRFALADTTIDETTVLRGGRAVAVRVLRALAAAEASGGARACLDMALAYAKTREQFGRIIGGFQAVKHHLADMLVRGELAVAAAWDAARIGAAGPETELAAAVASATALAAYERNARMNIQIHGGIGFTWEHDAHLFLRRATALAALAGPVEAAADDITDLITRGVRREFAVELPPEAEAFRRDARAFVERYEATDPSARRALLVESGYLVPHWRRPWGRQAGPVEQLVIEEQFAGVDLPSLGIGGWVLLTLTQAGAPEQVERWVRPSLLGDLVWCQLFSEPGAGSDAAAVQTRGIRVDGGWRVTGQKVWTSGAQHCNRGLATVRTDPEAAKHRGITTMVVDLTAPGVTVRPLREITGDALFNEVFFDDVFVPDEDVVGQPGEGWAVARATLGNERVSIGGGGPSGLRAGDLVALRGRHASGDVALGREIGILAAEEQAMHLLNLRAVERSVAGAEPSAEGNVTKLLAAEHAQRTTELGMRIASLSAVTGGESALTHEYLFDRALTIAGGTSEVSRNVIAERILGLPRESMPRSAGPRTEGQR